MGHRPCHACAGRLIRVFAILLIVSGCAVAQTTATATPGVTYRCDVIAEPRPNRIHILRIDLTGGNVRPDVVIADDPDGDGPAEAALADPRELAADPATIAFINTNPWYSFPETRGLRRHVGEPVDITGLAVSDGVTRSQALTGYASMWIDAAGNISLSDPPDTGIIEGAAGFGPLVVDGRLIDNPDDGRHPRTSIGIDKTGATLWLVVVDGRQKGFSEGMTIAELASTMHGLGCHAAHNLDGGGSSVMGLIDNEGQIKIVNSPSDVIMGTRRVRPVPVVLTIKTVPPHDRANHQ